MTYFLFLNQDLSRFLSFPSFYCSIFKWARDSNSSIAFEASKSTLLTVTGSCMHECECFTIYSSTSGYTMKARTRGRHLLVFGGPSSWDIEALVATALIWLKAIDSAWLHHGSCQSTPTHEHAQPKLHCFIKSNALKDSSKV